MKSSVLYALLGLTQAGPTNDHGQYHVHNPKDGVRDYKTGGPLNIHIVPHSHDDVGWLKTVDGYFFGGERDIQWTNVHVEIDGVIDALLNDPKRTFSEVEMKFFKMWWDLQTDQKKDKVRELVKSGQLELINGGWSMHDEACPIYDDMINNMMIGHDFIVKEFGVKPRIGWQIDPFGHSNTNTRIFAEMGFDALFFARIDYQDRNKRNNDKELEWVWMPSEMGPETNLLTHVLYNHYSSPNGMPFDVLDPGMTNIVDDPESSEFNVDKFSEDLINQLIERSEHYLTDEILTLFGDDFRYMNALQNYNSMDKLIKYVNENYADQFNLFYSTPSKYVDALATYDVEWPTKYDDMFPYSDGPDAYWTGYFSSRANDKEYVRKASSNFHASSQLFSSKIMDRFAS